MGSRAAEEKYGGVRGREQRRSKWGVRIVR